MRKIVLLALGAAAAAAAVQYMRARAARLPEEGADALDLDSDVIGDVPGWAGSVADHLVQTNGSH